MSKFDPIRWALKTVWIETLVWVLQDSNLMVEPRCKQQVFGPSIRNGQAREVHRWVHKVLMFKCNKFFAVDSSYDLGLADRESNFPKLGDDPAEPPVAPSLSFKVPILRPPIQQLSCFRRHKLTTKSSERFRDSLAPVRPRILHEPCRPVKAIALNWGVSPGRLHLVAQRRRRFKW